ncbi:hypothetical protein MIMGU_mgv11b022081mg [Erythranthe guttata]|uniref:Uncharacterized protein n=1 Tax=Erythranthe guttata TaxID=4155 RepID=A0A022PVE0_ERYGU|nr:hypothetical protein MIMGU_mgv11b022081mg [Erythranthe guttata]
MVKYVLIDCEPILGYLHKEMDIVAENRTIIQLQYLPYVTQSYADSGVAGRRRRLFRRRRKTQRYFLKIKRFFLRLWLLLKLQECRISQATTPITPSSATPQPDACAPTTDVETPRRPP